jgi:LacI family transcriptional regulator
VRGAEDALGEGRISVFLCDGRGDPEREARYVRTLLARRVDGIIVTARRVDPRPPIAPHLPIPVVYAMTQSTDRGDLAVLPDDEGGGRIAVEHLIQLGRRRIAHVTGPERFAAAVRRAKGALAALDEAGMSMAGGGVFFGEWSEEWGRRSLSQILDTEPHTDAIFCGSDQIARGVTDALRELGIRVPDDIAIDGYDNWEVITNAARPPLTTIDPNLVEVGRVAARELLAAINGTMAGGVRIVTPRLVVRESTGGTSQAPLQEQSMEHLEHKR